ncbi:MAG: c-type cytochrome domain-containing protein [Bdellovibrio sp.]
MRNSLVIISCLILTAFGAMADDEMPTPTFSYIEKAILTPKCVRCHSQTHASDGYAFDSYDETMKAVNTKDPSSSLIYTITNEGWMPPTQSERLSEDEEYLLLQWIEEGAQDN